MFLIFDFRFLFHILFMKRALTTLLIITLCSLAHATIPPLLPMPQKSAFTGKSVKDDVPVNEKIVSHIDGAIFQDEAYHILITSKAVAIEATTERGLYWARQTMAQLKTDKKGKQLLPLCEITDWPAFRIRGFMHDIGRSYIPVDELKAEIAMLSRFKINTNPYSGTSTSSHSPGTLSTESNVRHSLPKRTRRHGDGI